MGLSYGFFNAEISSSSGTYDRVYAAEEFAEYFHLIVANGVFPSPATQLQVVANISPNMGVSVSAGFGWINGYYAKNDTPYALALQAAHGSLNRIDAVALRWDSASRSMQLVIKTGTASATPVMPEIRRDADVYELYLATITVAAGATNITQSAITDMRPDISVCGWVTGAVQNIDATNLFAQYDAAFKEWFVDVSSQLEGDVATNLLNRIIQLENALEEKVNVTDKASAAEAQAGTDDTKWMTPKTTAAVTGTVIEESTGKKIKVRKVFDYVGIGSNSISLSTTNPQQVIYNQWFYCRDYLIVLSAEHTAAANSTGTAYKYAYLFSVSSNAVALRGKYSLNNRSNVAYLYPFFYVPTTFATRNNLAFLVGEFDSSTAYIKLLRLATGFNSVSFIALETAYSYSLYHGVALTNSYIFDIFRDSGNNHYIRYASASTTNFAGGTLKGSISAYAAQLLGIACDSNGNATNDIFFLAWTNAGIPTGTPSVGKFGANTNLSVTTGIATLPNNRYYKVGYFDNNYAYVLSSSSNTSSAIAGIVKISLNTGLISSNSVSSSVAVGIVTQTFYIGHLGDYAFFLSSNSTSSTGASYTLIKVNPTNGTIVEWGNLIGEKGCFSLFSAFQSSGYMYSGYTYKYERKLANYPDTIYYLGCLINTKDYTITRAFGSKSIIESSNVYDPNTTSNRVSVQGYSPTKAYFCPVLNLSPEYQSTASSKSIVLGGDLTNGNTDIKIIGGSGKFLLEPVEDS